MTSKPRRKTSSTQTFPKIAAMGDSAYGESAPVLEDTLSKAPELQRKIYEQADLIDALVVSREAANGRCEKRFLDNNLLISKKDEQIAELASLCLLELDKTKYHHNIVLYAHGNLLLFTLQVHHHRIRLRRLQTSQQAWCWLLVLARSPYPVAAPVMLLKLLQVLGRVPWPLQLLQLPQLDLHPPPALVRPILRNCLCVPPRLHVQSRHLVWVRLAAYFRPAHAVSRHLLNLPGSGWYGCAPQEALR